MSDSFFPSPASAASVGRVGLQSQERLQTGVGVLSFAVEAPRPPPPTPPHTRKSAWGRGARRELFSPGPSATVRARFLESAIFPQQ